MASIYHQIGVKTSPDKIFKAIATLEGLADWWTVAKGSCDTGEVIEFWFGDFHMDMKVADQVDKSSVTWVCIGGDAQWQDTEITFTLKETDQQTLINFNHRKWVETSELYRQCNTKWAVFLLSLKDYLETGKGRPFPNDMQINHS